MNNEELTKQIAKAIISCKKCRLCKTRIKSVPGEGNLGSPIVFIGEAPGQNEDEQGRPFVGRAGFLLDNLLGKINLKRSDVWIGNVIKCRPPENRAPMVDELRNCSAYLEKQLEILKPKLIVTLGRFALEHFIKDSKISKDHGVVQIWKGIMIYPLYHPAAALRNPQVGVVLEKEFKKIPEILKSNVDKMKTENTPRSNSGQMMFL